MAHKIVFHSCRPEDSVTEIINGTKEGFPLCCIAQYVSDGFNFETWNSADQRGNRFSEISKGHYVPCWDCLEQGSSTA